MINQLLEKMISYYEGDPKRIQHFIKVYSFAKLIGEMEGISEAEQQVIEVASIVHDIGIKIAEEKYGYNNGKLQEQEGPEVAREMLLSLGIEEDLIERVCFLVGHHHTYVGIDGIDYQILVEADFLVNFYEDSLNANSVETACSKIFKTKSGTLLCKTMYK
jgi:HD superfamily phosphodiesterase